MRSTPAMVRIYLFGLRCLVRDAMQVLLQQAGLRVIGADADPEIADAELLSTPADLLLADLRWGLDPVHRLLQSLAQRPLAPRCLLLLDERQRGDNGAALRSLDAAAVWHWLPSDVQRPALLAALADVAQGQRQPPPWRQPSSQPRVRLSPLEREVLQQAAMGHSSAATANALGLPHRTINMYRREAMTRLGLRDSVALARHALREGWTDGLALDEPAWTARPAP